MGLGLGLGLGSGLGLALGLAPRLVEELLELAQCGLHGLQPLRAESRRGAALPAHLAEEEGELDVLALLVRG